MFYVRYKRCLCRDSSIPSAVPHRPTGPRCCGDARRASRHENGGWSWRLCAVKRVPLITATDVHHREEMSAARARRRGVGPAAPAAPCAPLAPSARCFALRATRRPPIASSNCKRKPRDTQ